MQKIMFNDKYGLTQAVLEGRKTMTRRIAYNRDVANPNSWFYTEGKDKGKLVLCDGEHIVAKSRYAVGEIVAIAQPYKDVPLDEFKKEFYKPIRGWSNKLYVFAEEMPHQIRITDIKVERMQDISDEDCIKEGVYTQDIWSDIDYCFGNICFETAQHAFRFLKQGYKDAKEQL